VVSSQSEMKAPDERTLDEDAGVAGDGEVSADERVDGSDDDGSGDGTAGDGAAGVREDGRGTNKVTGDGSEAETACGVVRDEAKYVGNEGDPVVLVGKAVDQSGDRTVGPVVVLVSGNRPGTVGYGTSDGDGGAGAAGADVVSKEGELPA
jgi:hypothetical protein